MNGRSDAEKSKVTCTRVRDNRHLHFTGKKECHYFIGTRSITALTSARDFPGDVTQPQATRRADRVAFPFFVYNDIDPLSPPLARLEIRFGRNRLCASAAGLHFRTIRHLPAASVKLRRSDLYKHGSLAADVRPVSRVDRP